MPTYVYETIPKDECEEVTQFEVFQRMADDALTHHPETGQPVRRVITGGLNPISSKKSGGGGGCCDSGCSCG
ncbi:MAG: zinc ribbon domain-containing protein [Planctomycetota bacterium]